MVGMIFRCWIVFCFLLPAHLALGVKVESFSLKKPAFISTHYNIFTNEEELLVSSFSVFGFKAIYRMPFKNRDLNDLSGDQYHLLSNDVHWPNEIVDVPASVYGPGFLAVGTGFLVPGFATGSVDIINLQDGSSRSLTVPKSGYFYHKIVWYDVDQDGLLDIVTARAKKPMWKDGFGEILWLKQPENAADVWKEQIIAEGPDVNFIISDINLDGVDEIIATQFFSRRLSIHWLDNGHWKEHVVDNSLGHGFNLMEADLNRDGKTDLLVTNHEGDEKAAVYAYEIPENLTDPWTRHTLVEGIKTETLGFKQASPGTALAFHRSDFSKDSKPWIAFGGDGSTKVHLLKPMSEERFNWTYESQVLLDTDSTIGTIALADGDDDGFPEIYAPAYDSDRVYIIHLE